MHHIIKIFYQEATVTVEANETRYTGNQVGALQEYLLYRGLAAPEYSDTATEGPAHKRVFTMSCRVGDISRDGLGNTKKDAKVSTSVTKNFSLPDDVQQQAAGAVLDAVSELIKKANEKEVDGMKETFEDLTL